MDFALGDHVECRPYHPGDIWDDTPYWVCGKITDTKGTKALSMALDGAGFYQNVYEWTIGGKTFYQTMTGPRGRSAMGDD